ncbi:uncharacterized protein LOC123261260 [Cotesia glomerata]|uniref:uncharacterized protein LOC123261260 n=1 Tax=Cotesia glomerata TaxID=32391 RepID=UPI001D005964|nr:uncharacterized protein LOC123261260 [Cotesia glomerata]XP_044578762.1 uncharacterized protein LOC123261260 [Cotesia glomerata]
MNFDYQEYCMNGCDGDESYVVEWRQGKKPAGGWLCYDAMVTDVSNSIAALEKKFKNNYKGIKSPRLGGYSGNQKSFMDGSAAGSTSNIANATSITTDKNTNKKTSLKRPHPNDDNNDIERTPLNNSSPVRPRNLFGSNNGENDIVMQLLTEMRNMQENMRNIRPIPRAAQISDQSGSDDENVPDMVEIGRRGSGLQITREQWRCAKAQGRCTSMATSLLTALVPMNVLLTSNCKGGKARICKNSDNPPHHTAIPSETLAAIKYTVKKNFKNTYDDTKINTAINVKLTSLRSKQRNFPNNEDPQH